MLLGLGARHFRVLEILRGEIDGGKKTPQDGGLAERHARLPELDLDLVADHRAREGRWSLAQILRATLVGLMAGCRSLWEAEQLTETLSMAARRQLGLKRRLAGTTARDALCQVSLDGLRAALHRLVSCLPGGRRSSRWGCRCGWCTMTAALVSARGRPCIDVVPIPAETNEAGHFPVAFQGLVQAHGPLFDVVSYDAGGFSRSNADAVIAAGKDYLFALKDESRAMCRLAQEMLRFEPVLHQTVEMLDNGVVIEHEDRLYVSSLDPSRLTGKHRLLLVRSHWGVENNNHHTLDTAFAEDARPWIEADAHGMLAVLVLRRIAYSLLALFRSVTQRSDDSAAAR